MAACAESDCSEVVIARGWCWRHYQRWRRHGSPKIVEHSYPGHGTVEDLRMRFDRAVRKGEPDECWEWQSRSKAHGYGMIRFDRKYLGAHRVSLFLETGSWPPSDRPFVLHSCDNPLCCNPAHLRFGTHDENMADMATRGRHRGSSRENRSGV